MDVRVLDLDGSVTAQPSLLEMSGAAVYDLRAWGPRIRLGCSQRRFRVFEDYLADELGSARDGRPALSLFGSGDFHHVSLAILRRIESPCNLLIVDKHPDWMRRIPVLHCGTWVAHAARLPQVQTIFHVGGDLDFDNAWHWLAPWDLLQAGRIVTIPAVRTYTIGNWKRVPHEPLRETASLEASSGRIDALLEPHAETLTRWPLYVSVDKDVLTEATATVNWDSGHLTLTELALVLEGFLSAARGRLLGADTTGDWSPVEVEGLFRRFLDYTEHEPRGVDPEHAASLNQQVNLELTAIVQGCSAPVPLSTSAPRRRESPIFARPPLTSR